MLRYMEAASMDAAVLTVAEVARRLSVSPTTVYRLLDSGQLHGVRAGRLWRVPADVVDEYIRTGSHPNGEDDELSAEDLEAVRRGLADIQAGRYVRWEDLRESLGR